MATVTIKMKSGPQEVTAILREAIQNEHPVCVSLTGAYIKGVDVKNKTVELDVDYAKVEIDAIN